MATEVGNLIIKVDTSDVEAAERDLGKLNQTAQQTNKTTKEMPAAQRGATKGLKLMKGGSANLSMQLQDVAVQAQSGTNAMIILGQQGPQIASAFGPAGAAFGAIIAFGALFGGLAIKMLSAGSSSDALRERIRDLGKEFRELTAAQQAVIAAGLEAENNKLIKSNEKLTKQIYAERLALEEYTSAGGTSQAMIDKFNTRISNLTAEIGLNSAEIDANNSILSGNSIAVQDRIKSLKLEADTLGKSARQQAIINAQAEGAAPDQIAEINRIYDRIEAKEQEIEADKKADEQKKASADLQKRLNIEALKDQAKTEEQKWDATRAWFEKVEDRMNSMDSHAASFAAALSDNLANSFEGLLNGTMTAKEAFESMVQGMAASMVSALATMAAEWIAYQLMQAAFGKTVAASGAAALALEAQAMSVMAGISAFASTAAIPIVGPALAPAAAASAIAITGPMAAGVAALSAGSAAARALGGQVRGGESYIVGERGPEVLTMGGIGHITTNEKMKAANDSAPAQPVAVNLNVQAADTRDFDKLLYERRGLIMSMINKAVNDRGRASL